MFSPQPNNNYNHVKVKVRHYSPALNNLFYADEETSAVPSFNLEGIDGDYLSANPDSETAPLSSPHRAPPSTEFPFALGRTPSPAAPSSPTSPSSPPIFAAARANPFPDDPPTRSSKGVHKSIFSVFGNEDTNGIPEANGSNTSSHNPHTNHTPTPQGHDELMISFGSKVDTNKAGLRRAKKVNFANFASKGKVKVEPTMEDVHFCIYPYMKSKQRALFAVFDGHAGRAAADEASALFPKEFNTQLDLCSQNVTQAFMSTYAAVDEAMKEYEYMGTTATVVYLWQKEGKKYLQASNVGDSTAFLCRNGVSVRLTVDHKPSMTEEKERMRLAGIEISDNQTRINGLAVSRSLGNHFVKEQKIGMIATPYIGECIEILPTDTHLIVASDGLWDVVNSQHAMDIIRGLEALPAASHLLSTALASVKCNDNVSIIVVRLN
jgi:protein phosphatase PTC1